MKAVEKRENERMRRTINRFCGLLAGVAGVFVATSALGAPKLKVGDPAPPWKVSKWVQGAPVAKFEQGKVYIVEFWASWCASCKVLTPHLNEIHLKYKDRGVVVIGQDVQDEHARRDVPEFIKAMGTNMTYRIALDDTSRDPDGAMSALWMEASGEGGIPTAFIIDQAGLVAWIGSPAEIDEPLLDQIVAGKFDQKAAAEERAARERRQVEIAEANQRLSTAIDTKKWDDADREVAGLEKLLPAASLKTLNFSRLDILLGRRDFPAAYAFVEKMADAEPDGSGVLDALAWKIATVEGLEPRDLDTAERYARKALKGGQESDPGKLETLARVLFVKGDKQAAIATQKKVVDLTGGARRESYQKALDAYKAGKIPAE